MPPGWWKRRYLSPACRGGGVSFSPRMVKVTVPVSPVPVKEVPVEPRIEGNPAKGYRVEEVIVQPAAVQISAPAALLTGIRLVETPVIDISDVARDVVQRVNLVAPGAGVVLRPEQVQVIVRISPIPDQTPPAEKTPFPPSPGKE